MDAWVLARVAASLDARSRGATVQRVDLDLLGRIRFVLSDVERVSTWLVSIHPERPWIGRPAGPVPLAKHVSDRFCAELSHRLHGEVLNAVVMPTGDRWLRLSFASGTALVIELIPGAANLILLAPGEVICSAARRQRRSDQRLAPGGAYVPPPVPPGRVDPLHDEAGRIEHSVLARMADGQDLQRGLRAALIGVGPDTATLLAEAFTREGGSIGECVARHAAAVRRGEVDPVVACDVEPWSMALAGTLAPRSLRLLPWEPATGPEPSTCYWRRADPESTAGLYGDAVDRLAAREARARALHTVLTDQRSRALHAVQRATGDMEGFADAERFRRWGEALLAGLGAARREGDQAIVSDPYDPDGAPIAVPAPAGMRLTAVAEGLFRRFQRARRGVIQAQDRREQLALRLRRLDALMAQPTEARGDAALDAIETELRRLGVPIGLGPARRASATRGVPAVRLEGVRIFQAPGERSILVGRGARENHRLTFKLAGPEDHWFHALGVAGAHVILRNDPREKRPPDEVLQVAAAAAAWFSDAKEQPWADVQWTRRKYVRRPRGLPDGVVRIKRFETLRVRPARPPSPFEGD